MVSMMPTADPIMELTDAHRDGTIYVDGEGDLWNPFPMGGWVVTRRAPFTLYSQPAHPAVEYGPYVAVLGPPEPREEDI